MKLLDWLFPKKCFLCGDFIVGEGDLCEACEKKLPEKPFRRLIVLEGERALPVSASVPYTEKFRQALHRMKFQGRRRMAKPMGRIAARALPADFKADAVTWVPLSKGSLKNRGYDQSELLAREIARTLGIPCIAALEKVRETDEQHKLPRARRASNVEGAYAAAAEAAGKRLVLVDDIVTTGATLRVCAQALYTAGAAEVAGLCVADTPLED